MSETRGAPLSDYEEGLAQRLAALRVAAWRRCEVEVSRRRPADADQSPTAPRLDERAN